MNFCITASEIRKALRDLEIAEKNGFKYSLAVFRISEVRSRMLCDTLAEHDEGDVWAKAHPTDGNLDWGRGGAHKYNRVVRGKLKELKRS